MSGGRVVSGIRWRPRVHVIHRMSGLVEVKRKPWPTVRALSMS